MFWLDLLTCLADTQLKITPSDHHQTIQGMGCGAIFYEGHITSLASNGRAADQAALYDAMFRDVRTDFLQLMIRPDHEPENDNTNPYTPAFDPKHFASTAATIAVCKAARQRQPTIRFYATLYTPATWMKTNAAESAGGQQRATIKPAMDLELAEYCWAFLAHMHDAGVNVDFLSIANEPDWPHDQPGYCLTSDSHAALVGKVANYLQQMAKLHPQIPQPAIVGPNTLSAVTANSWLTRADQSAPDAIAVVASHDYDRRGDRIATLRRAAGKRPLWISEWCVNGKDPSPDLMRSASDYWLAMTEAFNQGANAWFAYDWAYPPRDGGEALIHIEWGKSYHLTRIYHGFRQWCSVLQPGMRVVHTDLTGDYATGISQPGIKAAAFLSADGKRLVAHVANVQDRDATIQLDPSPSFAHATRTHWRTTTTETVAEIHDGPESNLTLPARSLNTWQWVIP